MTLRLLIKRLTIMKKLLSILVVVLVTGCSSTDDVITRFEENALTLSKVDITYCEGKGFNSFQDLGSYWSFICKDGRKFIVKKI